jgi:formate dehydrogenase beta subunit
MFEEVEQTIDAEAAYREAKRCMRCFRIYSVITERAIPEGVGR